MKAGDSAVRETILIADDEEEIVSLIADALEDEGYQVWTAFDGEQAVAMAERQPDLIVLDVMMPGKDGYEVCQAIRERVACPILFLSARQSETDRVKGLALGGDDYIGKPFSLVELKARIAAHLRREKRGQGAERTVLRYGGLEIDVQGHAVRLQGREVVLTAREFAIVELLALHPGQVFSKEDIYDRVWGLDAVGDASTVTEHVKKIRAKLGAVDPAAAFVATVWGVGYRWERG
ncbi:response regulator transcription factor [Tumebacillus sp. DT12]|uniref:Response regulator transcription factor n=1 Tax=Tumebacillus lacus TaxID=2995335 RepID=A0ABT3WXE5_9BACL|nr:response regulator transcription factor [Tumebacillus lacus]MCX7569343.1 response regulator transcription factor [Tumebacillus lacus]